MHAHTAILSCHTQLPSGKQNENKHCNPPPPPHRSLTHIQTCANTREQTTSAASGHSKLWSGVTSEPFWKKKSDSHLPSLVYCLFSKTNLTRSMGFLKKNTPKKQVYGLSLCPSPILKFLCVCVCACIPLCKRVYLYVGHLVAIRVNHPSFLRLAVSHKLTWTHTMRHTQLLLEHDSALDGVGKKYWQPSRGQNGGGDGTRKGRMKDRQREGMKVEKQEERFQDVWNGLSHKNRRTW